MRITAAIFLAFAATLATGSLAKAEIRIGLAVPLSGPMASVGLAMQRALESAVMETNAAGGVLGAPLTLTVEDDGCARATAEGAATSLIREKPVLVIGHPCSSAASATAALYGNADVLFVAVGPRHPDVTRPKAPLAVSVLRLAGRDDRQGDVAARWLLAQAPGRRVAIVHDRTAYARGIAEGAVSTLKTAGVAPVAVVPIVANKHDYSDAVAQLQASDAEAVLFAGYPEEAAIVVAELDRAGLDIPLLGSDALATPEFAEVAGKSKRRIEVLLPRGPTTRDDADGYARGARAALEAWTAAARRAGSVDARTLSGALRGSAFATRALGDIRFDLNGDLDAPAFQTASPRAGRWTIGEK